ncbi:MAG: Tat pathway signal protein, partial [Gemmatimonadaceae bacterium]
MRRAPGKVGARPRLVAGVLAASIAAGGCAGATVTGPSASAVGYQASAPEQAFLDTLSRRTFNFFWETTNPRNGLTPDRWPTKSFSSVAAVGFALTAYPIGVERGWVSRDAARERVLTTLRFFWKAPQGAEATGVTGYRGF